MINLKWFNPFRRVHERLELMTDRLHELTAAISPLAEDTLVRERAGREQCERLQEVVTGLEGAGIRHKFGGNLDVDFGRFVPALDDHGIKELRKALNGCK